MKNSRRLKLNVDRARMKAAQANDKKTKKNKATEKIKRDKAANDKRKKEKAEENKDKNKGNYQKPKPRSNTVMMKSNKEGLSSSVSDSSSSFSGSGEINVFKIYIMSHIYHLSKSKILICMVFIR